MQIGAGFTGLDAAADVRDLTYDLTHWENTPANGGAGERRSPGITSAAPCYFEKNSK